MTKISKIEFSWIMLIKNGMDHSNQNLKLFRRLFEGREDVFAVRWKKGDKSGYAPAYLRDPYVYARYRKGGGSLKDFPKSYKPLTDIEILRHLKGDQLVGVYPLLENNTSWWIAADFDGDQWESESRRLMYVCNEYKIPVYMERSQSGNGGHVWIFLTIRIRPGKVEKC